MALVKLFHFCTQKLVIFTSHVNASYSCEHTTCFESIKAQFVKRPRRAAVCSVSAAFKTFYFLSETIFTVAQISLGFILYPPLLTKSKFHDTFKKVKNLPHLNAAPLVSVSLYVVATSLKPS